MRQVGITQWQLQRDFLCAKHTCVPVALASELLPIGDTFLSANIREGKSPHGQDRAVLESRSESILAADVVSCRKTTVQAGTELSCEDLWFSLFRWKSIYVEIYMKRFAISMREFHEIVLEGSHFRRIK